MTHFTAADLNEVVQSDNVNGLPIDLAVDSQARPVVWTEPRIALRGSGNDWNIWRLKADLRPWTARGATTAQPWSATRG